MMMLAHYMALAFITPRILEPKDYSQLGKVLVLAAILSSGYLFVGLLAKQFFDWPVFLYLGRPVGSFGNPNYLAGFLVVTLPFVWYFRSKLPLLAILPAVILTWSRGAIVALILVAVLALRKKILAGLIIVLVIFWLWKNPGQASGWRPEIYYQAIAAARQRPLTGYGLENFELVMGPTTYGVIDKTHNEILEVLVSSGAVGLSLWLAIVAVSLKNFWQTKNYPFFFALVIFLLKAQTNVVSTTEYALFWLLVGLALNNGVKAADFTWGNRYRSFSGRGRNRRYALPQPVGRA